MNPKISNKLDREFADSTSADFKYDSDKQEFILSFIDYNKKLNTLHFIKCTELNLKHPSNEIKKNGFIDLSEITGITEIPTKNKEKGFEILFACFSTLTIKCRDFYYEHYE
ncbi:MAG: hypothetical protein WC475_02840 [Candidatus Paceibacterota bacterium]